MIVSLPPFQQLVDTHWRDVARLAHALAGPVEGDDVAQQAWLQALAAYPRLTRATNLRSWLLTITHRCAMDRFRVAARSTPHDEPASLAAAPVAAPPTEPRPDVWAAVAALPGRQREVVVLRFVADLDHAAIGTTLGISTVMSRRVLADALATLRLSSEELS